MDNFSRSAHATDPATTTTAAATAATTTTTTSRKLFSKSRSRRCDEIHPRIVQIGAILAIFRPFEVFRVPKKSDFCKTLNGRLPPEDGSVRPQTLGKRVSDDPRHFIFRRKKKYSSTFVRHFRTLTAPQRSENARKCSRMIWKQSETSGNVRKCPKISKNHPKTSENRPKTSENV